jgi:hypothetical protein
MKNYNIVVLRYLSQSQSLQQTCLAICGPKLFRHLQGYKIMSVSIFCKANYWASFCVPILRLQKFFILDPVFRCLFFFCMSQACNNFSSLIIFKVWQRRNLLLETCMSIMKAVFPSSLDTSILYGSFRNQVSSYVCLSSQKPSSSVSSSAASLHLHASFP